MMLSTILPKSNKLACAGLSIHLCLVLAASVYPTLRREVNMDASPKSGGAVAYQGPEGFNPEVFNPWVEEDSLHFSKFKSLETNSSVRSGRRRNVKNANWNYGELRRMVSELREYTKNFSTTEQLDPMFLTGRLQGIFARSKADLINTQILGNAFGWGCGFASRVNGFINELALATFFNQSYAVCNSTFMQEVYQVFYDADLPVFSDPTRKQKEEWDMDASQKCGFNTMFLGMKEFSPRWLTYDPTYIVGLKRFLHQSVMTLKPQVKREVMKKLDSAGFPQGAKYLGLHIRRGDKRQEAPLIQLETFAKISQMVLTERSLNKVYIASDDPIVGPEMRKLLPTSVMVWHDFEKSSGKRAYGSHNTTFKFLLDVEALKMSEVFIGTQSSGVSRMIYYGRPESSKSISLDGDWLEIPKIGMQSDVMRSS